MYLFHRYNPLDVYKCLMIKLHSPGVFLLTAWLKQFGMVHSFCLFCIENFHGNWYEYSLEIIFGNVLSIVCLEKETKGETIKLFYLITKADKYFQFYKLLPFRIVQYSLDYYTPDLIIHYKN
jgi:hypothetical protein